MSPTPDRIASIINANAPTHASEVTNLLGMAQYISHFTTNFSESVAPLRRLPNQDVKFRGGVERTSKSIRESQKQMSPIL